jgi:hypothetical protein
VAALLLGAQLTSIGFLAELITAYQSRDEDSYSVAEQIDGRPAETATSPVLADAIKSFPPSEGLRPPLAGVRDDQP